MKICITEKQLGRLYEVISDTKVTCNQCGWSWNISEGGDDPFICHKCGHNNEE